MLLHYRINDSQKSNEIKISKFKITLLKVSFYELCQFMNYTSITISYSCCVKANSKIQIINHSKFKITLLKVSFYVLCQCINYISITISYGSYK